jgi:hypothetical protein
MAHIKVPDNLPGILGPMAISPESTKALRELAEVLLRGPNTLTQGNAKSSQPTFRLRTIAVSASFRMVRRQPSIWLGTTN